MRMQPTWGSANTTLIFFLLVFKKVPTPVQWGVRGNERRKEGRTGKERTKKKTSMSSKGWFEGGIKEGKGKCKVNVNLHYTSVLCHAKHEFSLPWATYTMPAKLSWYDLEVQYLLAKHTLKCFLCLSHSCPCYPHPDYSNHHVNTTPCTEQNVREIMDSQDPVSSLHKQFELGDMHMTSSLLHSSNIHLACVCVCACGCVCKSFIL